MKILRSLKTTELIFKGLSSSKRLLILDALDKTSLSLSEISEFLHFNLKTTASHCQRLEAAGLISKKKKGRMVKHSLTYLGRGMLTIARRTRDLVERK
ncbi:winged helix-turn-helix domain-containing protein [Patescibacteria group bacterium]|nr:winged helix-turn-helix domain-containing protein [Patescibacteria group bacterium]